MKFIARKPVVRTEVYRKYGFTYVEHKQCEDYIVTNQHAEYLRKRIKVVKK